MYTSHPKLVAHAHASKRAVKSSRFADHDAMGIYHAKSSPNAKTLRTGSKRPSMKMIEKLRRQTL